ncbi:hypothetical protein COL5a_005102 [Colletotrichum fioriniae]|nr:hypothetical protein COL5a_005102 [Colletotrichum fioriniae]
MNSLRDILHLNRESVPAIVKYLEATVAEQQSQTLTEDERDNLSYQHWDNDEPEEPYMAYEKGMLHPVQLGDQLGDGKYTIIAKLGNGSFSTVWLAHNAKTGKKVAVKIYLHGGNVMLAMAAGELASLTVEEIFTKYGKPTVLPIDLCVESTDFHERHPLPKNAPPYMLWKMLLTRDCDDLELSEARAQIKDFGESWQPELVTRYELNTPEAYRAPESMIAKKLQLPISYPADVWALGCFIFELYGRMDIFGTYFPGYDGVFATMVHCMGKPPASWWDAWENRDKHIDDNCNYVRKGKPAPPPAEPDTIKGRVLKRIPDHRAMERCPEEKNFVPEEELQDLAAMLMRIFRWEPEDRVTAEELMSDPWMQKWGIPAKEAMEVAYEKRRKEHEKPPFSSKSVAVGLAVGAFNRLAYILSLLSPTSWWRNLKWALGA